MKSRLTLGRTILHQKNVIEVMVIVTGPEIVMVVETATGVETDMEVETATVVEIDMEVETAITIREHQELFQKVTKCLLVTCHSEPTGKI